MNQSSTRFIARTFVMIETSGGAPMFTRPYEATGNGDAISAIQRTMDHRSSNNQSITPGDLASFAGQLIRPSVDVEGVVNIPNGWDCDRLRFVLEVEACSDIGRQWYIVTGYTSHSDVSLNGNVDPRMDLFFNNVIRLRESTSYDAEGRTYTTRKLAGNYQIFCVKDDYADYQQGRNHGYTRPQPKMSMTPTNVLGHLELEAGGGTVQTFDTRRYVGAGSAVSMTTRQNNLSAHYLARTTNALDYGLRSSRWSGRDELEGVVNAELAFTHARENAMTSEPNPIDDDFVQCLANTQYPETGHISYEEMQTLFGRELDEMCRIVVGSAVATASSISDLSFGANDAQAWDTRFKETEIASQLVQSIPSLMSECLLSRVVFHASNNTQDGLDDIEIVDGMVMLADTNSTDFYQMFIQRFKAYVAKDFSFGGRLAYDLSIDCELAGDTRITLRIDGGYTQHFFAPSYCDNLYAPTLTNSSDRFTQVAADIRAISGF
jgi:hypothetical protein